MHPDWQFDHIDPLLANPLNEVLADLRAQCPVTRSTRHGGFTAALSYDVIKQVPADHTGFSSTDGIAIPRLTMTGKPPAAIALILGMPPQDGTRFLDWVEAMFVAARTGEREAGDRALQEFRSYIANQLERQRSAGADTVALAIANGTVDGRPLSAEEQIGTFVFLIIAGHETTVHGLSAMLYFLATVEGLRQKVIAEPALIGRMIDECLRIESPVVGIARTARGTTDVAAEGERVLAVLSAANHDPAVFEEPATFGASATATRTWRSGTGCTGASANTWRCWRCGSWRRRCSA